MKFIFGLIERFIFSLIMSFILFLASFSFMTGKFPPRLQEIEKSFKIAKGLLGGAPEFNALNQNLQKTQAAGQAPTLEQIEEIQRLALERTRMTTELMRTFNLLQNHAPSAEANEKIVRINQNLKQLDADLNALNDLIRKSQGP
jgi:hypothetical protein